jgi:hypothetical protein
MIDAPRDIWFGNSFARFVIAGDWARNSFLNPLLLLTTTVAGLFNFISSLRFFFK